MSTHDPQKIIEDLRNHLAEPERPLAFLFGAGTSCAVNATQGEGGKERSEPLIPAIMKLTEQCQEAACKEKPFKQAWQKLVDECIKRNELPNIENILSRVIAKKEAVGEEETLLGLQYEQLGKLEKSIRRSIVAATGPDEDKIPSSTPHDDLALWIKMSSRKRPLEIFTTNYDILIERSLERARVPVFDGFVGSYTPFFMPESLEQKEYGVSSGWTRLWKLHGSINWEIVEINGSQRTIRVQTPSLGQTILPSFLKYDESRKMPYTALLDHFTKFLNQENTILLTCGYSFGDQHINSIIFTALDSRATSNVICLNFEDIEEDAQLVHRAKRRKNLTIVSPNAGVVSGRYGHWQLLRPISEKNRSFMQYAFRPEEHKERNEAKDGDNSGVLTGKMLLGDFNFFCKFLKTMPLLYGDS